MSITILRSDWHWALPKNKPSKTSAPAFTGRVITGMLTGGTSSDDRNQTPQPTRK